MTANNNREMGNIPKGTQRPSRAFPKGVVPNAQTTENELGGLIDDRFNKILRPLSILITGFSDNNFDCPSAGDEYYLSGENIYFDSR